jgi:peptide/nickel transport system permease protein
MSSSEKDQTTNSKLSTEQISEMEKAQSFSKMVYNQFKENKAAICGAYIIIFFVLVALFAPIIGSILGVDPNTQNVFNRYKSPMTKIMASADVKEAQVQRFIQVNPTEALEIQNQLISKKLVTPPRPEDAMYEWVGLGREKSLSALSEIQNPKTGELKDMVNSFESMHVFGTDELGRDVLMRLVYGARVSMGVGVLATIVSALIGLLIGSVAGYYGGFIDTVLMRVTDSLIALPLLPVLVVVAAIDLQKIPFLQAIAAGGNESIIKLVFIMCLFSWMTVARLVRGSVLTLREREFILASKTLGATDFTIILRHMFPNVIAPLLVSVTLGVGNVILFEAALSFLGLGIQPPMPSWGNMLFNAQELIYQAPFLAIIPGILIFLVVVSFNFLGDGLQDAIDPKAVKR